MGVDEEASGLVEMGADGVRVVPAFKARVEVATDGGGSLSLSLDDDTAACGRLVARTRDGFCYGFGGVVAGYC